MKKPRSKFKFFGAIDTETIGFDGDAIYCTLSIESDSGVELEATGFDGEDCITKAIDKIYEVCGDNKILLYAHNLNFDLQRIIESRMDTTYKVLPINNRPAQVEIIDDHNTITLRDSYCLLPQSLKKLTQSFAKHAIKKDIQLADGVIFDPNDPIHCDYAKHDVYCLLEVLKSYANIVNKPVTTLKLTASGEAFHEVKRHYFEKYGVEWKGMTKEENLEFLPYYNGGRNLLPTYDSSLYEHHAIGFDITASYGASMLEHKYVMSGRKPVKMKTIPKSAKGIYFVHCYVAGYYPDFPMLPVKVENGSAIYPVGNLEVYITDVEYRYLTEKQANYFDAIHIIEVLYFDESKVDTIFDNFINHNYKMRLTGDELNKQNHGSGDGIREVGKLRINGGYGKFAQKYHDDALFDYYHADGKKITKKENNDKQLSDKNDHRHYANAALITAHSRIRLYQMIDYYGIDNICTADTDGVKVRKTAVDNKPLPKFVNTELGGWKCEGDFKELYTHAPKCYTWQNDNEQRKFKCKGIPFSNLDRSNEKWHGCTIEESILDVFKNNTIFEIEYKITPNTFIGFIESGDKGRKLKRTVTIREQVKGYNWNPEKNYYEFVEIYDF